MMDMEFQHFKMLSLMVYESTRRTGHMEPFHIKNTTQKNTAHLRCENFYKKSVPLVLVRFVEALD